MRILFIGQAAFGKDALDALIKQNENIVGVITLPDVPGQKYPNPVKELALELGIPVLQPSKMKDPAAIEWVRFLLSEEAQLKMAERGVIPTLSTVIGDPSLPDYFGVFLEQLKTAQARVPHPKWGDMDGAINNAYQRMLRGEQSAQEALDQAAQEINALLGQ